MRFLAGWPGKQEDQDLPWISGPSLYEHIVAHIDPDSGRLKAEGDALPDEERRFAKLGIRWVPGALEGAFGASPDADKARLLADYVLQISARDALAEKIALYNALLDDDVLAYVDEVLEEMARSGATPFPYMHRFAHLLATIAPDRGPVKFAIALLGIMGIEDDTEIIRQLGLHEEFTLYSAVALANLLVDPEAALWELAQKVEGWGRIHLVERLSSTNNPQIKDWLLRDGYRNNIMYEYLAYACATGGDLKGALLKKEVDNELLRAAGEIIEALVMGGPAEDIGDYRDAAVVVRQYLRHLEPRAETLEEFNIVATILDYVDAQEWDQVARQTNGWNEPMRNDVRRICQDIMQQPQWVVKVQDGLNSEDVVQFHQLDRAGQRLGIDTWPFHWSRLQQKPLDSSRWYPVALEADADKMGLILDFALSVLPLEQVATGPADEFGLGPEFEVHSCLEAVLQELDPYPGQGWPLIAAALKSPVIRQRNRALRVLSAWGQANWPVEAEAALAEARLAEPLDDVRERIETLLAGGMLD